MKIVAVLGFVLCIAGSGELWADSISLGSAQPFGSVFNPSQTSPTVSTNTTSLAGNPGNPFWNNWSYDSVSGNHNTNVGYLLSNTGGFTGADVFNGTDSVSTAYVNNDGSDPSAFTFTSTGASQTYDVTLLGAYSGNSNMAWFGTQFGIYYVSGNTTIYDELYGPGANAYTDTASIDISNIQNLGVTIGFYAIVCNNATAPVDGTCPAANQTYYYSDSTMNSGFVVNNESMFLNAGAYNHFSVFGLSSNTTNDFAIGFKDGPTSPEGLGDFNDVVIEFADPSFQTAAPEPATLAIVGAGLLALGLRRRRTAK